MPSGSSRWRVRSPLSRSTRSAPAMASTPVGTLIQKIHRHETYVTISPPSTTPSTAPIVQPSEVNP